MPVSIRDVARLAGVSVTTVSRVVNDKAAVRKDTRKRVVEAMAALNWTPRDGVHRTVGHKTHTVALLLPDLYGEFFAELIRGINQSAARSGHHLVVSGSHSGDAGGLETVLRTLRGRVDGLIVLAADRHSRALLDRVGQNVPVVLVDSDTSGCDLPSVTVDNFGGARAMTRHLFGLGHRRIAFITGPPGNHDAGERQRGWRKAFAGSPSAGTGGSALLRRLHRALGTRRGRAHRQAAPVAGRRLRRQRLDGVRLPLGALRGRTARATRPRPRRLRRFPDGAAT